MHAPLSHRPPLRRQCRAGKPRAGWDRLARGSQALNPSTLQMLLQLHRLQSPSTASAPDSHTSVQIYCTRQPVLGHVAGAAHHQLLAGRISATHCRALSTGGAPWTA